MHGSFPNWPFMDVGAEYTTAKAVYLSPSFAGFDFAISFEPEHIQFTDPELHRGDGDRWFSELQQPVHLHGGKRLAAPAEYG